MRDCEREELLCTCIDWDKADLADKIHHVISNFDFTGFELNYTTLEPEKGRLLCKVGRCRICGKRLCYGDDLPAQSTPDDLLADIFRRALQMWDSTHEPLPDGAECFTDLFVSLFHEADRERVNKWLAHHGADTGEGT